MQGCAKKTKKDLEEESDCLLNILRLNNQFWKTVE